MFGLIMKQKFVMSCKWNTGLKNLKNISELIFTIFLFKVEQYFIITFRTFAFWNHQENIWILYEEHIKAGLWLVSMNKLSSAKSKRRVAQISFLWL